MQIHSRLPFCAMHATDEGNVQLVIRRKGNRSESDHYTPALLWTANRDLRTTMWGRWMLGIRSEKTSSDWTAQTWAVTISFVCRPSASRSKLDPDSWIVPHTNSGLPSFHSSIIDEWRNVETTKERRELCLQTSLFTQLGANSSSRASPVQYWRRRVRCTPRMTPSSPSFPDLKLSRSKVPRNGCWPSRWFRPSRNSSS